MSRAGRRKELLALFSDRRGALHEDLRELVVRESPSEDAARVSALAAWIVGRLAAAGVAAESVPCVGRGDAVLARVGKGAESDGGTLLLGHIDTVWPAGTLAEIPFSVEGDVARGPGVFDMKAGVAVALALLPAVANGDVAAPGGVSLFLSPDEEIGSAASRARIEEEARRHARVLVLEPSGDDGAVKVARKGTGFFRVTFQGVAAHAGLEPEKGASALAELARFVLFAESLARPELGTSVTPTVASAGTKTNVVPERAEVFVDGRVWTLAEGERLPKELRAYVPRDARVSVAFEGDLNRPPMEPTAESLAAYETARSIAADLGFELPSARVGGASDGNFTAAVGVPTLDGLGPSGGGAHARTEHLLVSDLPRRAALLAALLEEVR